MKLIKLELIKCRIAKSNRFLVDKDRFAAKAYPTKKNEDNLQLVDFSGYKLGCNGEKRISTS